MTNPQPSARPIQRSVLRLMAGRLYFRTRRHWDWFRQSDKFATTRHTEPLPYPVAHHATPLLRSLKDVDMWLQHNKITNLSRAVPCLDGLILSPGKIFSYWYLIGNPSARKGYVPGMILRNGTVQTGIGGGLCQLSNLTYWITLHTPLTVRERWRHGYDVFPDAGRTQPFGSGATCAYNHIDLQIENRTTDSFQLRMWMDREHLRGEWRSTAPARESYRIKEASHRITSEWWGGYMRRNTIVRDVFTPEAGRFLRQEFVTENHAVMMYNPLLAD